MRFGEQAWSMKQPQELFAIKFNLLMAALTVITIQFQGL